MAKGKKNAEPVVADEARKIKTGETTDLGFIRALKEKGVNARAMFPAETLRDQLDGLSEETKVSFESTNETILATVNEEAPAPVVDLSIDFDVSDDIDLFGKVASDLQTGVAVEGDDITGTLRYVSDYTGFSSKVAEQSGNYLVLHVDTESEDDVYVEVVNGTKGPVKLDEDRLIVLRIADKDTQGVKVTTGDLVKIYGLSELTVEPEPVEEVTVTFTVDGLEAGDSAYGAIGNEAISSFPAEITREKDTVETLEVTCEGYETVIQDVTFDADKTVNVTLEKEPETFDIIFRTFDLDGTVALGFGNEGAELNPERWELVEDSEDTYELKDSSSATIVLDGDVTVTDFTYNTTDNCFKFPNEQFYPLAQKYGVDLAGCPVAIEAVAGLLVVDDATSNAVDIDEIFQTEHLPNWVVDVEEEPGE